MQEATDTVHDGLATTRGTRQTSNERLAIANHALHTLAGIEENSRDTLKYISQEARREFQDSMSANGKTFKELCTRRNGIARSLWLAHTKASIVETFPMDTN